MNVLSIDGTDRKFYSILGPFLGDREIIKELGSPIYAENEKRWFVAMDENQMVMGFVGLKPMVNNKMALSSFYVIPQNRNQGIGGRLMSVLVDYAQNKTITATVRGRAKRIFLSHGFTIIRKSRNYIFMERRS